MPTADKELILHLNAVLKAKLTGINQYFLHARMLKHQGAVKIADYEYKASIDAMKHADMLIEYILSRGGAPTLSELGKLSIGDDSRDMLRHDLKMAEGTRTRIKAAAAYCEQRQDGATIALLNRILESQQEHINFLRQQLTADLAAA